MKRIEEIIAQLEAEEEIKEIERKEEHYNQIIQKEKERKSRYFEVVGAICTFALLALYIITVLRMVG